MEWTSFRYRPEVTGVLGEFAERSAVTAPESLCQTQRHMLAVNRAAYLELITTSEGDEITIHRAWFTCSGCHAALEAEYDPAVSDGGA